MDNTINFSDIIKKSFLERFSYNAPLTLSRVVVTLLLAFIIGLFIFYVYKRTFRGVLYTHSFNISLIMSVLVTTLVIMTISSNITLSLGMVGALSIVRFRTAIKDPTDTVFIFWAIAVGITCGAGIFLVAIVGSLIIGLILLLFSIIKFKDSTPYLLIVHYDTETQIPFDSILQKYTLKSKTVTRDGVELTLEIRIKDNDTDFINDILNVEGVRDAALVSYNGDYIS